MLYSQVIAAGIDEPSDVSGLDAGRLQQGVFSYRDLDRGKEVGTSSITIRKLEESGKYRFLNVAAMNTGFSGFRSQRWQATARANFAPVSAALEFVGDKKSSPIFELHYEARRVRGFVIEQKESAPPARRLVDDPISEDTVDQRIDWAAVMSAPLKKGRRSEFSVYDPGTGVSRVVERVGASEAVKTPAGTFQAIRITYDIDKRGKVERYIIFTTQKKPRVMVREDFPNGVVTELIHWTRLTGG